MARPQCAVESDSSHRFWRLGPDWATSRQHTSTDTETLADKESISVWGSAGAHVDLVLDLKLLILLFVANGAPVVAKNLLKRRFQAPLDAGLMLFDNQPVLGHSKTFRGVFFSLLSTSLVAPLLGIKWILGLAIAASAMFGDLLSSFLKRRLKMPTSSQAIGIDQLPEALLPLLVCFLPWSLTLLDVVAVVAAFFVAELLFSKVLFKFHIRDRPY